MFFPPSDNLDGEDFQPDFEPTFLGRFNLVSSNDVWADVYADVSLTPEITDALDLEILTNFFDPPISANPLPEDADLTSSGFRGPFFSPKHVEKFFQGAQHLRAISEVYYDDDQDVYWVDIEDSP